MNSEHKKILEDNLGLLIKAKDKLKSYHHEDPDHASDFKQWCSVVKKVDDVDEARRLLYYGIQPMHDAIYENDLKDGFHDKTVEVYTEMLNTGVKYLTDFYLGKPNLETIRSLAKLVAPIAENFTKYYCKKRNTDFNGVYNSSINIFVSRFIEKFLREDKAPDVILGCACGGFEMAMALAGVSNIPFEVIKYSKRRGDSRASFLPEHEERIVKAITGKSIALVDDYVCDGNSMREMLKLVHKHNPSEIVCASVVGSGNFYVRLKVNETKFNLYEPRWDNILED